jgi:hypothetical protein
METALVRADNPCIQWTHLSPRVRRRLRQANRRMLLMPYIWELASGSLEGRVSTTFDMPIDTSRQVWSAVFRSFSVGGGPKVQRISWTTRIASSFFTLALRTTPCPRGGIVQLSAISESVISEKVAFSQQRAIKLLSPI